MKPCIDLSDKVYEIRRMMIALVFDFLGQLAGPIKGDKDDLSILC